MVDDPYAQFVKPAPAADPYAQFVNQPPKVPDVSSVQKIVQDNLSANNNEEGEAKDPSVATPQEQLNNAAGYPLSEHLSGNGGTPPEHIRAAINGMYKDGTAVNAADAMQTIVPTIAHYSSAGAAGIYAEASAVPTTAGFAAYGPAAAGAEALAIASLGGPAEISGPFAPLVVGGAALVGGIAGALGASYLTSEGQKSFLDKYPQIAEKLGISNEQLAQAMKEHPVASFAGSIAPNLAFMRPSFSATGKQIVTGAGLFGAQEAGQEYATEGKVDPEKVAVATIMGAISNKQTVLGAALSSKIASGMEALKPIVGKILGKDPATVTHDDINQTIADSHKPENIPSPKDYETVAAVMDKNNSGSPDDKGPPPAAGGVKVLKPQAPAEFDAIGLPKVDLPEYAPGTIPEKTGTPFAHIPDGALDGDTLHMWAQQLDHNDSIPVTVTEEERAAMQKSGILDKDGRLTYEKLQDLYEERKARQAQGYKPTEITPEEQAKNVEKRAASYEQAAADAETPEQTKDYGDKARALRAQAEEIRRGKAAEPAVPKPSTKDTLQNIYEKTGVKPEQVWQDAQSNPAIGEQIAKGEIPDAYHHLMAKPGAPKETGTEGTPKTDGAGGEPPAGHPALEGIPDEEKPTLSTEGESASRNPLAKIFNPAGMSEASRDMATALRQGKGPETRDVAQIQDALQKYAKTFSGMSDEERLKFISYLENRSSGADIHDPELQAAADKIKDIYAQIAEKIKTQFPDVGLRRDYFTHQYEDPQAAAKFFSDWVAKQGSERNLNQRAFPTLSEAMAAGLKPRTTNPIETVMNYATNMGKLFAAHRGTELAREYGVADYFKNGQQPPGWEPLKGNLSEKDGKLLFAPEDAARVYNNDISEGATGPAGDLMDSFQHMNNFGNKLVLGLSGYHFTATTMASMSSDVGRAITSGSIPERIGDVVKALTPGANTVQGGKLIDAYLGRSELSPEMQRALDLAVKNNTVNVRQQDYWKAGPAKDYVDVFKNGSFKSELKQAGETLKEHKLTGPVRIIANEIGRTMDTIAKPLFDFYIPRIKISANISELHDWLKAHPDATPEMQDRAAQDIGNSIDNRFGEMMRDNLFWHQITRQTLQTTLLSYSWVTGAARMLKGIPDTAQFLLRQKELSSSARYLFGMAATYAVVNGIRTYIGTGQAPDNYKDFIYPRTGGVTPQGKPERELIPSHIGQYTNYLHEGIGELGNEASPALKLIYHLATNSDWRGLPITNNNNKWYSEQRWSDYLKYVLGEETPIGLKTFLQGNKKGSAITNVEKALGVRQASRRETDPEGYEKMMEGVNNAEYKKKTRSDTRIKAQYENPGDQQLQ